MASNPMDKAHAAPRCRARSKRSGIQCKCPAVRGWKVCRMHGAHGGAPEGKRNGNYRTGFHTKAARADNRAARELIRGIRKLLAAMDN